MVNVENLEKLPKKIYFGDAGYSDWYNFPLGFSEKGPLSWNVLKDGASLLVSGKRGSGKTTMAGNLIQHANTNADRWNVVLLNPEPYNHHEPLVEGLKNEKYFSDFFQCSEMLKTSVDHLHKRLGLIEDADESSYLDYKPAAHAILIVIDSADKIFIVDENDSEEIQELKNRNAMNLWAISRQGRQAGVFIALMSDKSERDSTSTYGGIIEGLHVDFEKPEDLSSEDWPCGRATIEQFGIVDVAQTYSQKFFEHKEIFD